MSVSLFFFFFFFYRALQPSAGEPPASAATGGERAFWLDCEYNAEYRLVPERLYIKDSQFYFRSFSADMPRIWTYTDVVTLALEFDRLTGQFSFILFIQLTEECKPKSRSRNKLKQHWTMELENFHHIISRKLRVSCDKRLPQSFIGKSPLKLTFMNTVRFNESDSCDKRLPQYCIVELSSRPYRSLRA